MTKEAHILQARIDLGARLRDLRVAKNIKQYEMAQRIGVTSWTVCKIEGGKFNVSMDAVNAYAREVGATVQIVTA